MAKNHANALLRLKEKLSRNSVNDNEIKDQVEELAKILNLVGEKEAKTIDEDLAEETVRQYLREKGAVVDQANDIAKAIRERLNE